MSETLKLSHNELSALLKLTFQGLFGHSQDWEALADYIVWLETHGFDGVSKMIDDIQADAFRGFDGTVTKTPDDFRVDCNGNSLLMALPMLTDLIIAKSATSGSCHLTVENVHGFDAIVAVDAALRERGIAVNIDQDEMTISTCANQESKLFDYASAEKHYAQSLCDGVSMARDTYTFLNRLAERTLVEATEASRRGAGE